MDCKKNIFHAIPPNLSVSCLHVLSQPPQYTRPLLWASPSHSPAKVWLPCGMYLKININFLLKSSLGQFISSSVSPSLNKRIPSCLSFPFLLLIFSPLCPPFLLTSSSLLIIVILFYSDNGVPDQYL